MQNGERLNGSRGVPPLTVEQKRFRGAIEKIFKEGKLNGFATKLCKGDAIKGEDLTHETLTRCLSKEHLWKPRTGDYDGDLQKWVFTVLRNGFLTSLKKRKREVEDPDGFLTESSAVPAPQESAAELRDLSRLLSGESTEVRELVRLLGEEYSYEEIAEQMGLPMGTAKSRASRTRAMLSRKLS